MPRTPSRRTLLQGGAAASAGMLMSYSGSVLAATSDRFTIGAEDFLLDGKPLQIRCGEMHFPRVPREYWGHRLKAIKAMGLNTVCAYLFWNYHEWREGKYDWAGQRDAAEFCRMAQAEGLWVILRPGPYACAEWEMGGLPWWLLKNEGDAFLRTRSPAFTGPAHRWLAEVGRVLGPLQVTHGGPILMVQVENEYGFFGNDLQYMRDMRQALLDAKFDVPLFQCNPTGSVTRTHIPELLSVANFGSDPAGGFKVLDSVQKAPRMCGEFYSGWFDTWGGAHRTGDNAKAVADIRTMLEANGSFSLYMAHGGTTFGLWAGCDRPFQPDTSSYDYDAPISEAGWTGEKFERYREGIRPFLKAGETLPPAPARNPVMAVPSFSLEETAALVDNLPGRTIRDRTPRSIEQYDISRGLIVYKVMLPAGPGGVLKAAKARDLAWVSIEGAPLGTFDMRHRRSSVRIPARLHPALITVVLYTLGRVNFGVEVHDRKGLQGPVTFTPDGGAAEPVENWRIQALDLDADATLPRLKWKKTRGEGAAFHRGHFTATERSDTFLNMSSWGMGVVWVNGRCLGRYWNIGPTQTMYLPGPWIKAGRNEVVVLDLTGPAEARIAGQTEPILNQLRRELDLQAPEPAGKPELGKLTPAHAGEFAPGAQTQDVRFAAPVTGNQFCLETLSALDGGPSAAVAEIALLDANGQPLNQSQWTIAYVSSEEVARLNGAAVNAINGQSADFWHSAYTTAIAPAHPHLLVIDLGASTTVAGVRYTPRQGNAATTGRIKGYRMFVGDDLTGK
jgi:beta-galactosidase